MSSDPADTCADGGAGIRGGCFCGAVEVVVRGRPEAMGYCHCRSCRHWSAAPVNAFSLWRPEAVTVTQGRERLAAYRHTPASVRKWCTHCGGHVLTEHPELDLVDVYAAVVPDLAFEPGVHVHYGESVMAVADDLPRYVDVPAEMGGSGERVSRDADRR